jgi:membrane glycosyltransferase
VAKALETGPEQLDNGTRLHLLSDPVALSRLHDQVWSGQNAPWLSAWRTSIAADPNAPSLPLAAVPRAMSPVLQNA